MDSEVIVVGAGLAGLAAARLLAREGREVTVLEARERPGGRLLNGHALTTDAPGPQLDLGGQWVGAGHARVLHLAREFDVPTFSQWSGGRNLMDVAGKGSRYRGSIPRLGPRALWDVLIARRRLDRLAASIPVECPWSAPDAAALDSMTLDQWLHENLRSEIARKLVGLAGRTIWGAGPDELSMLHVLFYVRSAGSFDALIDTEGGAQQDRLEGGAARLPDALARELGSLVHFSAAVDQIEHDHYGVRVTTACGGSLTGRRVVIAGPPAVTGRIRISPQPDAGRLELGPAMPPGRLTKCLAVYDAPFWREQGLSGEAVTDAGPVTLTFDSSPQSGSHGVLLGFVGGPEADALSRQPAPERSATVLECFERLFGPRAARPLAYREQAWASEPWSLGGPTANFGPGGWTACGPALREPVGPIHWAGTETATEWAGYMEGALQSAERVSAEVLSS